MKEALKLALEALCEVYWSSRSAKHDEAITAIKKALAQPEQICGLDVVLDESMPPNTFKLAQPEHSPNCALLKIPSKDCDCQDQQEPVAWLHTKIEGIAVPHRPADLDKHPDRWTALYPESKPCPTCEALARTVMMDQTAHDAQRKPLSNQKIIEMYNEPRSDAEMIEFARAIEAAHGIWPENSDCYGPDWTDRDGEYLK